MNKSNTKKQYNQYNPAIIKQLKTKYGLTTQFIMASIRGDRTSDTSLKICDDFKRMEREINKSIKNI